MREMRPGHQRSGSRTLDTAEGVIVAIRRCSLDQAFVEIVRTAQQHSVAPLGLAAALVALAENQIATDVPPDCVRVAQMTWTALLDGHRRHLPTAPLSAS